MWIDHYKNTRAHEKFLMSVNTVFDSGGGDVCLCVSVCVYVTKYTNDADVGSR